MKRLLPLFLAVILCFTFVGCSEANDHTPQTEAPSEAITQIETESSTAPTEETTSSAEETTTTAMPETRTEPVRTKTNSVEAQPRSHSLALKDRRHLAVTGVIRVISCDETAAVLETPLGNLTIGGQELSISELSVQSGQVQLSGKIEYMQYAENKQSGGSLLNRLFR